MVDILDLETLQLWLAEARVARHKLITGVKEVSLAYDGKSITYTAANIYRLDAYIADLARQIATLSGVPQRRGPVQFVF